MDDPSEVTPPSRPVSRYPPEPTTARRGRRGAGRVARAAGGLLRPSSSSPAVSRDAERENPRRRLSRLPTLSNNLDNDDALFADPRSNRSSEAEPTRRNKRRKTDHSTSHEKFGGFKYGHNGQVVPGQLQMEILSCDGGTYSKNGTGHEPENLLKNDISVYCSEASICNIILKHRGDTAFTLDKLVIKSPERGYNCP
jgi:hypothetical protein